MEKKCRFCPRVCHKQEHLDRHERTHTKVRPYRCDKCEKHFVRSDTLKRHQKLHLADARKSGKDASSRALKRRRSDTTFESNQSDQLTESSVDQSPTQETVEPQFFYDSLGGWDYPSLDPIFDSNAFAFPSTNEFSNYFTSTNLLGVEENSNVNLTVSPDSIWRI